MNEEINPINTALGAYVKNTAQSTAGIAFGINFCDTPWKAGINSDSIILTPLYTIVTPTAKLKAEVIANTI